MQMASNSIFSNCASQSCVSLLFCTNAAELLFLLCNYTLLMNEPAILSENWQCYQRNEVYAPLTCHINQPCKFQVTVDPLLDG